MSSTKNLYANKDINAITPKQASIPNMESIKAIIEKVTANLCLLPLFNFLSFIIKAKVTIQSININTHIETNTIRTTII